MRLKQAEEARRIFDEELAATDPPSRTQANERTAARLKITPRTLFNWLVDAPAKPDFDRMLPLLIHQLNPSLIFYERGRGRK
jgi:hypothetical protein